MGPLRASTRALGFAGVIVLASCWAACASDPASTGVPPGETPGPVVENEAGTGADGTTTPPGPEDEQFPPDLRTPYTGPPIAYYDNTFVTYWQFKSRIASVFADTGIGGNTDTYLASKISLLGGADFVTHFSEARTATQDFLLALDAVAKDACARAGTNKTGPFAGANPEAVPAGGEAALVAQLYQRMLFRAPTAQESTDTVGLVATLLPLSPTKTSAWAGVCEVLVRHPDSIFTLPPSVSTLSGPAKERMQLVKLTTDLVGRPPTDAEFTQLAGKSVDDKVEYLVGLPAFRDYFFHRARVRTESLGTPESDEPARLWTYIMTSGAPLQELLTADYTVDAAFAKTSRPAEHGKTGILTMPGFIKTKPGLPHYNYAARVMTDYMGQLFEVSQAIIDMRVSSTAASTVAPGSVCYGCHSILTPLATQRSRWSDDGVYHATTDGGAPIDDSDRNLADIYPFKGQGMEGFATSAVRKEKFFRQSFQAQFLFYLGRHMRYSFDERTVYLALWNAAYATNGNTKALVKIIANMPTYLGN